MAGHIAGGSNSEAHWRVTLGIAIIGDLEGQTQRRNGGSHCDSHSFAIWRVKLRGAMAGHIAGGSNSEAHWRVTLGIAIIGDLEGQTQRRNGGSHCGSHS